MGDVNFEFDQIDIESIVQDYLFNVSSLINHDYFSDRGSPDGRSTYFQSQGFQLLNDYRENYYVTKEEMFLEGCTRVFLINPIIKKLLELYGIKNEWRFGNTFANYTISNREYELEAYIEFIAIQNGRRIGFRHTRCSYSAEELAVMNRDNIYLLEKVKIPGFVELSPIDEIQAIDWSGISENELSTIHGVPHGMTSLTKDISVKEFFQELFSNKVYDIFIFAAKGALKQAKEIISLKAVPQLLPNNMLTFKDTVMNEFTEDAVRSFKYEFRDENVGESLPELTEEDIKAINQEFFNKGYRYSFIGNADFAKCFITSEYLFRTINKGLSIDYTSVVSGYLKSVEQLLYIFYISAFEGVGGMAYWDNCNNKDKDFDISTPQYRYEPYNFDKQRKQKKYYHKKKTGKYAPTIGTLILFLRYLEKMWNVSEGGKEYIFRCFEDFCAYCRNHHFHKDNIESLQYDTVVRIKNNTYVCLYYMLGAFKLLDANKSFEEQLGIENYSFERLYKAIRQERRRVFWAKTIDGYEGIIFYLNQDSSIQYDESGRLVNTILRFLKVATMNQDNVIMSDIHCLLEDGDFVRENTIMITRDLMPAEIKQVEHRRKN